MLVEHNRKLSIGRFGNSKSFSRQPETQIKFLRKKTFKVAYQKAISFAHGQVFDGDSHIDVVEFINNSSARVLLVLTNKERWKLRRVIHEIGSPLTVRALENDFPLSGAIKYQSCEQNYAYLIATLESIKQLGYKTEKCSTQIYEKYNRKIARKITTKSSFDNEFKNLSLSSFSDTFVLAERRRNRKVYCLDFNSMYSSCMLDKFSDFKSLYRYAIEMKRLHSYDVANIPCGIFRVILRGPKTDFIKKYHPIRIKFLSQSLRVNLDQKSDIELVVTRDDLEFFCEHFDYIYLVEAYVSDRTIAHPLANQAKFVLKKKSKTKNFVKNIWKLHSTILHTACVCRIYRKKRFANLQDLIDFVRREIVNDNELQDHDLLTLLESDKNFNIKKIGAAYVMNYADYSDNKTIYSLYHEVLSKARVKLLRCMNFIYQLGYTELCYANIDSIHVSIPNNKEQEFVNAMEPFIGTDCGQLKIEAIGDAGYWFGIGRYWILNNKRVIKHANSVFNINSQTSLLADSLKFLKLKKYGKLRASTIRTLTLENSFSGAAKVCSQIEPNFIRYERFETPENVCQIRDIKMNEKFRTKKLKKFLFDELTQLTQAANE